MISVCRNRELSTDVVLTRWNYKPHCLTECVRFKVPVSTSSYFLFWKYFLPGHFQDLSKNAFLYGDTLKVEFFLSDLTLQMNLKRKSTTKLRTSDLILFKVLQILTCKLKVTCKYNNRCQHPLQL